jgi:acyl-CoA reductase-like NAD-dependent aldehyde dehydrogenase
MRERLEDLALTITREEGKVLAESRMEASRAADVIALSAEEARRIAGEMIPLEGAANGAGKIGFTLRVPCGVVAAITPFNFPLNLWLTRWGRRSRRATPCSSSRPAIRPSPPSS